MLLHNQDDYLLSRKEGFSGITTCSSRHRVSCTTQYTPTHPNSAWQEVMLRRQGGPKGDELSTVMLTPEVERKFAYKGLHYLNTIPEQCTPALLYGSLQSGSGSLSLRATDHKRVLKEWMAIPESYRSHGLDPITWVSTRSATNRPDNMEKHLKLAMRLEDTRCMIYLV